MVNKSKYIINEHTLLVAALQMLNETPENSLFNATDLVETLLENK